MGKILRLSESELISLIERIISEDKNIKKFSDDVAELIINKLTTKNDEEGDEDGLPPGEPVDDSENEGPPIDPDEPSSPVSFLDMTIKVIKNLEGGYYNPAWHYASEMGNSGETMFGLDRKHGGDTVVNSPAGKEFWKIIDKNKTKEVWKRYHRGGKFEDELTTLAAKVMEPVFYRNLNNNFNESEKKIILNHKGLIFNFIYASWNGQGWFERFANTFKTKLAKGVTNPNELNQAVIDHRKNSSSGVIKKGGRKIDSIKDQFV